MSSNKPVLVLAVLVLLAGALLYRGLVAGTEGVSVSGALAVRMPAIFGQADVPEGAPPIAGAEQMRGRMPPMHGGTLRSGFEQADDLYYYVQSLAAAAAAGDADALWMISRVYDYCAGYAADPGAYAHDTHVLAGLGLRASASMVAARERVSQRCQRFAPSDRLGPALVLYKRIEAAEAGSLAAEAALLAMGEPLDDSEDYRRDLVERAQESKDPEVFLAVAPALGMAAGGDTAYTNQVAGSQLAELAWQVAGCRLGADCGPNSALMTSYCANGGICSRDGNQDFEAFVYDAAIPRQGEDEVDDMVDSLLSEGVPK